MRTGAKTKDGTGTRESSDDDVEALDADMSIHLPIAGSLHETKALAPG